MSLYSSHKCRQKFPCSCGNIPCLGAAQVTTKAIQTLGGNLQSQTEFYLILGLPTLSGTAFHNSTSFSGCTSNATVRPRLITDNHPGQTTGPWGADLHFFPEALHATSPPWVLNFCCTGSRALCVPFALWTLKFFKQMAQQGRRRCPEAVGPSRLQGRSGCHRYSVILSAPCVAGPLTVHPYQAGQMEPFPAAACTPGAVVKRLFSCATGPTTMICLHPHLIILWGIKLRLAELVASCNNTPGKDTVPSNDKATHTDRAHVYVALLKSLCN